MDRTAITKIRLSNHDLKIEKGRHEGLILNERLCPFCKNTIEDEQHFLINCETFNVHRTPFFTSIADINHDFANLDETAKFHFTMTKPEALELTGEYLNRTLQVRKFLLENHKQNV